MRAFVIGVAAVAVLAWTLVASVSWAINGVQGAGKELVASQQRAVASFTATAKARRVKLAKAS